MNPNPETPRTEDTLVDAIFHTQQSMGLQTKLYRDAMNNRTHQGGKVEQVVFASEYLYDVLKEVSLFECDHKKHSEIMYIETIIDNDQTPSERYKMVVTYFVETHKTKYRDEGNK